MKQDLSTLALQLGQTISIRLPHIGEAESLFETVEKNREHLRQFMWWVDYNTTVKGSIDFINDATRKAKEGASLHLCIYSDAKIIGTVGFHFFDYINQRTEIAYWIAKEYEGKGIVTTACKTLIRFAFDTLHMHRIELKTDVRNVRSINIAKRLGFTLEGTLRDDCKLSSGFHDMYLFSLLSSDKQDF